MLKFFFRSIIFIVVAIVALLIVLPLSSLGMIPLDPKVVASILCSLVGVLLIAGIVGGLVARYFFKKMVSAISEAAEGVKASGALSAAITLEPRSALVWSDAASVAASVDAFRGLGFRPDGYFEIKQTPGVKLQAFTHAGEQLWGILYEHPKAGVWADLVACKQDGGSVTVSNAPMGGTLDHRPNHDKVYLKGSPVADLFARMQQEVSRPNLKPVDPGTFKAFFERAYMEEMAWRVSRGGVTEEEIRRQSEASGEEYSQETLQLTHQVMSDQARETLKELALREFAKLEGTTYEELQEKMDEFIVVDDAMPEDDMTDLFEDHLNQGRVQMTEPDGRGSRSFFKSLNGQLTSNYQYRLVRELTTPVAADVYMTP